MSKIAIIGGTGEVGKALLAQLIKQNQYSNVHLIARRTQIATLQEQHPNMSVSLTESVIDFEKLCNEPASFTVNPLADCDKVFCCLGTTRATAGSAERFIRIDKDYVLACAQKAKEADASEFHYCSSSGANAKSMFLYPKTKGEIENALKALNFNYAAAYRPALLLCNRTEKRFGESIIRAIGNVTSKFMTAGTTKTCTVGNAMITNSLKEKSSVFDIFENDAIHKIIGL